MLTKHVAHYGVMWHHYNFHAQLACGYAPLSLICLSA
jgi:hypothetical protein